MALNYIAYLLIALTATIIIEWALSWAFFKERHDRIIVVLAQCVTNPLVNLWLIITNDRFGMPSLSIAEICAVAVEFLIYEHNCQQQKRLAIYVLTANICSFSLGLLATSWQI